MTVTWCHAAVKASRHVDALQNRQAVLQGHILIWAARRAHTIHIWIRTSPSLYSYCAPFMQVISLSCPIAQSKELQPIIDNNQRQTLLVDECRQGSCSFCQVCKGGYDDSSAQHSVAGGSSLSTVGLPMSPQHEATSGGVVQNRLLQ